MCRMIVAGHAAAIQQHYGNNNQVISGRWLVTKNSNYIMNWNDNGGYPNC